MAYSLDVDLPVRATIDVLPEAALRALSEVFALPEISPWSGRPINPELNPDGPVRVVPSGATGLVTYLVLENLLRVDVLRVTWAG
jgi:hypothetical protein